LREIRGKAGLRAEPRDTGAAGTSTGSRLFSGLERSDRN